VAKGQWNYSFDSHDLDAELTKKLVRPVDRAQGGGGSRSLMEALVSMLPLNMLPLSVLPRMVGLNSDLLSGNASLAMNGSVLSAEQRVRFGSKARPSLGEEVKVGAQIINGFAKPQVRYFCASDVINDWGNERRGGGCWGNGQGYSAYWGYTA